MIGYGFYGPQDMQRIGRNTGISLMSNMTLPFIQQSTNATDYLADIPLPRFPKAYGYNILLLSANSAAVLDMPSADFIADVRSRLLPGESWTLSASVLAAVTRQNDTVNDHRDYPGTRPNQQWYVFA
jgi:hypothetical protein